MRGCGGKTGKRGLGTCPQPLDYLSTDMSLGGLEAVEGRTMWRAETGEGVLGASLLILCPPQDHTEDKTVVLTPLTPTCLVWDRISYIQLHKQTG